MRRHALSPEAEQDLKDIWLYIAHEQSSPETATRLIKKLTKTILLLTVYPDMGTSKDDLMPIMRSFRESRYTIYYQTIENVVNVVRVLDGARDIHTIFNI